MQQKGPIEDGTGNKVNGSIIDGAESFGGGGAKHILGFFKKLNPKEFNFRVIFSELPD